MMCAGGLVVTMALLPLRLAAWLVIPAAALPLAALLLSVPWGPLLRRLLWLEPLAAGVALMAVFQPDGWRICVFLLAKSSLCLMTMVLLTQTTPFAEILRVLHAGRLPPLLLTTLALMHRYLAVLGEETHRMQRARLSRTFVPRRRLVWHTLATVLSQLFVRASERAERIYAAMCARGWQ